MIFMADSSQSLGKIYAELGGGSSIVTGVEQLLTPLTRFNLQNKEGAFCIDNGAFKRFDAAAFMSLLEREDQRRGQCRWVAAPDVLGSAIRTLELFEHWRRKLQGWPLALVCQDGQELEPVPWHHIAAIFIGGSTKWKLGPGAAQLVKAGVAWGKWVHIGRVNSYERIRHFARWGANSFDGSGLARYTWMRERVVAKHREPQLGFELE